MNLQDPIWVVLCHRVAFRVLLYKGAVLDWGTPKKGSEFRELPICPPSKMIYKQLVREAAGSCPKT